VVGKLLIIQLKWLQLIAGTSVPVLEESKKVPYLQECWLSSLHGKLVEKQIRIKVADIWRPTPRREYDRVIMDYVRTHIPEKYWTGINQCRLYLRAIMFSDLTTTDRTIIPETIYLVAHEYRKSWLTFPIQKRPPRESREKWKYFIEHITGGYSNVLVPMGGWIKNRINIIRMW